MDIVGAQADDDEQDFIRSVCEKEIVSGENLLAQFAPLIIEICSSPAKYPDPKVFVNLEITYRSNYILFLLNFLILIWDSLLKN